MKYLVFRLYGPLVSWGEIAVGGERHSSPHPSKSAILGIVAAALGVRRDDEEKHTCLFDSIGVGVKLLSGGGLLPDYHTTQVAKPEKNVKFFTRREEMVKGGKINTILSNREYRTDSMAVVALWEKSETFVSLEAVGEALKQPVFHLYLGRKSCPPGLPMEPQIIEGATLKEGLDSAFFHDVCLNANTKKAGLKSDERNFKSHSAVYFWEENSDHGMSSVSKTIRYDVALSRKRWQFVSRDEYMAFEKREEL